MLGSSFLLLWMMVAHSSSFLGVSSQTDSTTPRIVGGISTGLFEFPFMASIQIDGSHSCGGTLVHHSWVLTAAHCVYGMDSSLFQIHLHRHYLDLDPRQEDGIVRGVSMVICGSRYLENLEDNLDDIAFMKLDEPVTTIDPVPLDTNPVDDTFLEMTKMQGIILGWGNVKSQGIGSDYLRMATVEILEADTCQTEYLSQVEIESQICAGRDEGGVDACQGDSGGPLLARIDERLVQVGVVSYGYGCGNPKSPGVYTRVSYYNNYFDSATYGEVINLCGSGPFGGYFECLPLVCHQDLDSKVCVDSEYEEWWMIGDSASLLSLNPLVAGISLVLSLALALH